MTNQDHPDRFLVIAHMLYNGGGITSKISTITPEGESCFRALDKFLLHTGVYPNWEDFKDGYALIAKLIREDVGYYSDGFYVNNIAEDTKRQQWRYILAVAQKNIMIEVVENKFPGAIEWIEDTIPDADYDAYYADTLAESIVFHDEVNQSLWEVWAAGRLPQEED